MFQGTVFEVIQAVDAEIVKADAIDGRLLALRQAHPTPEWEVATLARAGSVYDCIWASLRATKPQFMTPHQQVLVLRHKA